MGQHATLSASQTKDWWYCSGIIPLAEMFPVDDPSGPAAQLGTCAHALVERCLNEGVPPAAYAGRLIEIVKPNTDDEGISFLRKEAKMPKSPSRVVYEVDDDMIEATTAMVDYVVERLVALFPDRFDTTGLEPDERYALTKKAVELDVLKPEGRVNPLPERDDTGGTADVTIDAWPEMLEVIDYKNGSGVFVPVDGNKQLRSYTLGRAVELGNEDLGDYPVYRYAIVQPRHHLAPSTGAMVQELDPAELSIFRRDLRDAAERVDRARECLANYLSNCEKTKTTPTEDGARAALYEMGFLSVGEDASHCTWCRHRTRCPAAKAQVQAEAGLDFEDEPEVFKVPEDRTDLARVLKWKPFIESYLKACAKEAEDVLLRGDIVPGKKMVRKSGNRAWIAELDEKEMTAWVLEHEGAIEKLHTDPTPPKLVTGPQAEKAVPAKYRGEFGNKFLYKPEGGLVMVDESDDRPAVTNENAADDFDEED